MSTKKQKFSYIFVLVLSFALGMLPGGILQLSCRCFRTSRMIVERGRFNAIAIS
jgi:hypothetical protein